MNEALAIEALCVLYADDIRHQKNITSFRDGIRSAIRGYWDGSFSIGGFFQEMKLLVERELWIAFYEGVELVGLNREDVSAEERQRIEDEINNQIDYIMPFAVDIRDGKEKGSGVESFLGRAEMWVTRYGSIKALAQIMLGQDEKLEWELGDTTEHCNTCARLNGIVKRASVWNESGIKPGNAPNESLECEGWNCRCSLRSTRKRCTSGPLPQVP
jgi:hypothetical protein